MLYVFIHLRSEYFKLISVKIRIQKKKNYPNLLEMLWLPDMRVFKLDLCQQWNVSTIIILRYLKIKCFKSQSVSIEMYNSYPEITWDVQWLSRDIWDAKLTWDVRGGWSSCWGRSWCGCLHKLCWWRSSPSPPRC